MAAADDVERLARELTTELGLPHDEAEAVAAQARRVVAAVRGLEALALGDAEPAPVYGFAP